LTGRQAFLVDVADAHGRRHQGRQAGQEEDQRGVDAAGLDFPLEPAPQVDRHGVGQGQDSPLEIDEIAHLLGFAAPAHHERVADHVHESVGGEGQIEGHQVNEGHRNPEVGQQCVEGPENGGQERHEDVPGFAVVAPQGPLVRNQPPHRLDEPARLAQGVKELSAGIPHAQHVLDEVENRHLGQGAGALHEIGGGDDPAHPAQAQIASVPAAFGHASASCLR